jgi:hypothetical protein
MARHAHEESNPPPAPPARRGLRLVDLLILVAASAIPVLMGITQHAWLLSGHLDYVFRTIGRFDPASGIWWSSLVQVMFGPGRMFLSLALDSVGILGTILVPMTFALVLIRLVPPRPDRLELWSRPGFVATVAAAVGMLLIPAGWTYAGVFAPAWVVPAAVSIAWIAQAIGRKWGPERSWIDRAGRAVGVTWLAMTPILVWLSRQ